jgi:hypothetical protein
MFTSWSLEVGRGLNKENHIYNVYVEKKIFSRTSRPISTKLKGKGNHNHIVAFMN